MADPAGSLMKAPRSMTQLQRAGPGSSTIPACEPGAPASTYTDDIAKQWFLQEALNRGLDAADGSSGVVAAVATPWDEAEQLALVTAIYGPAMKPFVVVAGGRMPSEDFAFVRQLENGTRTAWRSTVDVPRSAAPPRGDA